jgi:glucan phosphoethanolaminetransferase (alkaline phosphatase superfamily)
MESIASLMPFAIGSLCAFVFLALTQETRTRYPLSWKRSLFYTAATALMLFGLFAGAIILLAQKSIMPDAIAALPEDHDSVLAYKNSSIIPALGSLIPFVLPGGALLALLILSEKDRKKPWLQQYENKNHFHIDN